MQKLKADEAVGLPTETVYGLAGRALHPRALARIFQLKARPHFDPLIMHVLDLDWVRPLVKQITPLHERLVAAFWPGPLTLLFERNEKVPDLCTAESPWVAIRSPAHPVFRYILALLQEPLAAPSANRFGRISPTSAADVLTELGPYGLEAVVDGGRCEKGIESTVVKILDAHNLEVLRPGAVALETLRAQLGSGVTVQLMTADQKKVEAPGLLESHYAPRTPLYFFENEAALGHFWATLPEAQRANCAYLEVFPTPESLPWQAVKLHRVLSQEGSESEAATELFRALRSCDEAGVSLILARAAPGQGLGIAINDRLRRAGVKNHGANPNW